ncbi:MAG: oligopeptide transporter permease protein [Symbiobacteriaceae bacterium]|nr:oligopeptide transporter permease protein [Symbiobacteriaceae bacterium]
MIQRYYPAFARFGGTLLAGGILLKLLAGRFSAGITSTVGIYYPTSLGSMVQEAVLSCLSIAGRGLAISLPAAVLLGLLAGLRPGSRLDRNITLPTMLLAGLPALPALLTIVSYFTLDLGWLGQYGALHLALGIICFPWLTLAIRRVLAGIIAEGEGLHPARGITAIFGAVLSQAGNLALGALAAGVYLVPDTGLLRLLELGSRLTDPVLLYTLTVPAIFLVALVHLAGDCLEVFAGGQLPAGARQAQPAPRPLRLAIPGAVLLLAGLFAFIPYPAATANTLIITLGAAVVALLGGSSLALLGPLMPRTALPSLLPPIMLGCLLPVLAAPGLFVQILAIGLACAATMAAPIRRLAYAEDEDRGAAATATLGALLLAAGQALAAAVTLGVMNVGLPDHLQNLGHVVRSTLLADPGGQHYGAPLLALALGSGLFLLGFALMEKAGGQVADGLSADLPQDQVPVEPDQEEDPAQQSAGAD